VFPKVTRNATPASRGERHVNTRIGTLEFTHDFGNGYPTKETIERFYDERDLQRACQRVAPIYLTV